MSHASVIVFNGGVKTAQKAQDCPNVKEHFQHANLLSEKIWDSFDNGEISFDDRDRLVIQEDFKLYL